MDIEQVIGEASTHLGTASTKIIEVSDNLYDFARMHTLLQVMQIIVLLGVFVVLIEIRKKEK